MSHFTVSNANASIYLQDAAQLLITIKNLTTEAEQYRAEWEDLIPPDVPLMLYAIRVWLYPNAAQREYFAKTFGCCRWVYNDPLAHCQRMYEAGEKRPETGQTSLIYRLAYNRENCKYSLL